MMVVIPFLIAVPVLFSVILAFVRNGKVRSVIVYIGAACVMALSVLLLVHWLLRGGISRSMYMDTEVIDNLMIIGDIFLMCLVVYQSIKYRRILPAILSVVQTGLIVFIELTVETTRIPHMRLDGLSMLMCILVAFVGGFICIYSVGYMKGYHHHHTEFKDRQPFFFSMLFLFLGAMFGLVLSLSLIWLDFFWEVTSLISYLLIGYTRTEEAITNGFCSLWMNLLGGLGFAVAIAILAVTTKSVSLSDAVVVGQALPIACLALGGLAKAAQMPFSTWLLGAMVAPTPSSALLHSATMVKAGVYLLIRLGPAFNGSMVGTMVAVIGGFTFIVASIMAISQSDAKKVLAYSTISNLGLIVACAGVGREETIWGAILLMIFHAVSKSMLFQSVGATENSLGSRDIEDMHGLLLRLPRLTYIMGIGIAGMYLAPFGMLISKWVALKAFVDSGNILLVLFIAYGSASTVFYWTKWLSKLMTQHHSREKVKDVTRKDEYLSMTVHAVCMVLLCFSLPLLAERVVDPILRQLFGYSYNVLSMGILTTMVIMLVSVVVVPVVMYFVSRRARTQQVPIYMNGINEGDNRNFTNSLGEPQHLYLTNWYLSDIFGEKRLLRPSQYAAACGLIVVFCMLIGGVLV